mmetsp:Transcript_27604/g.31644  ORF Transcript_27604/g.31644 Transcript_27604/m.31644 type:complete len:105 (-) Transcript_27604:138-452(-)
MIHPYSNVLIVKAQNVSLQMQSKRVAEQKLRLTSMVRNSLVGVVAVDVAVVDDVDVDVDVYDVGSRSSLSSRGPPTVRHHGVFRVTVPEDIHPGEEFQAYAGSR